MSGSQILKICNKLELSPAESADFTDAITAGNRSRSALVITPSAPPNYLPPFPSAEEKYPWVPNSVLILPPGEAATKPGSHSDYEKGYYYPLDLSSVWETVPLTQIPFQPKRCLDMCSAPGGKSILTQTRIAPSEHIANEIQPKRLNILRHNLNRCGFHNLFTQRLRPDQWATYAPESFDLILVDAPCSGQSLLAKGIKNPGCFNNSVVSGNAKRQRGILISAITCLAPGGYLLYTTCTYAPEENERNINYILKRHPELSSINIPDFQAFRSALSEHFCYRLMPHHGIGAGGFACLIKKEGNVNSLPPLADELLAWPVTQTNSHS